jgi:uncharacterized protein YgiM (DUF1202 family)
MRKSMFALAIFALAIGCSPILPMQRAKLPMQTPTALAISTRTITPLPTQTRTALAMVTAARSLHVRVRPGEQQVVIGYLYNADRVTLTGSCRSGWAQIVWKSATAWVRAKYLSDNICKE